MAAKTLLTTNPRLESRKLRISESKFPASVTDLNIKVQENSKLQVAWFSLAKAASLSTCKRNHRQDSVITEHIREPESIYALVD